MKSILWLATAAAFLAATTGAFAPPLHANLLRNVASSASSSAHRRYITARPFGVDPGMLHDAAQHGVDAVTAALGTFSLADVADAASSAVVPGNGGAALESVANDASQAAAAQDNGWFGFLTGPTTGLLQGIHSGLVLVGVNANAWGVSIVLLTLIIKAITFPLTKSQLESTTKMQALQPKIKEIQAKYQSNPEVMNQKIAEFYQVNEINPLAGCLPSLVQIPVFIGLYRAVLQLAKEDKLDEPFLFLPNLEGPTYGADPQTASDWILKGWTDAGPPLGWDDTISFLILPFFLVISQYVSMELMQPKTADGQAPQNNLILKILPVMIGWFALNVPAALSVYWVVNNIVTTATSLLIRNNLKVQAVSPGASSVAEPPQPKTIFAPPPEKPAGFAPTSDRSSSPSSSSSGGSSSSSDGVRPITSAIDVEIVEEDEDGGPDDDDDDNTASGTGMGESSTPSKKSSGGGKKKRKRSKK